MTKTILKAAVVQAGSALFDTARTLRRLNDFIREAAARQADLVVFPEAFVGGYPKGLDFGARIGSRSAEGRADFLRYFESAVEVPGDECASIGTMALENKIHVVVGVIERAGGTLYCAALTFSPDGKLINKHRKLMPTASERLVWGFGDGSTIGVADTEIGKIGSVICWENYMPQLRLAMYAQGVELYCAPTVDDREAWLPTMRTIALEGRCFVLSACQYLLRSDCPDDYAAIQGDNPSTVLIRGGSCIIDPLGDVLVPPIFNAESIQYAELDRRLIAKGKFDLDVVGHYARPDIFQLNVNTREQRSVVLNEETGVNPKGARRQRAPRE
jgi:nitrilase